MINFSNKEKEYLLGGGKQTVRVRGSSGEILFDGNNIKESGVSINRTSVSGNNIEIGSAIAAEATLIIDNSSGEFDDVYFDGIEFIIEIKAGNDDDTTYRKLGHFIVDEATKSKDTLTIVGLDKMIKLDVVATGMSYPMPLSTLIRTCCDKVGLGCYIPAYLANLNINAVQPTSENVTYRQLICWATQLMGACAYIAADGRLYVDIYKSVNVDSSESYSEITTDRRFDSDYAQDDVMISGCVIRYGDKSVESDRYLDEASFVIEGNELVDDSNAEIIADGLSKSLRQFVYRPISTTALPFVWLQPLDCVVFVDNKGISHLTAITDWTWTLNNAVVIESKGEALTKKSYLAQNAFTPQQQLIIEKIEQKESDLDGRTKAILKLNSAVSSGLTLYTTERTTTPKGTFLHDAPKLEDSTFIATSNSGGFAFTNLGWNNGNPVWEYGISSDGDAIINALSAYRVSASVVKTGVLESENNSTRIDLNNGTFSLANGAISWDGKTLIISGGSATDEEARKTAAQAASDALAARTAASSATTAASNAQLIANNAKSTADTADSNASTALNASQKKYGTCDTSATTQEKTVNCSGFSLFTGATINVKFTNKNDIASPTLNVHNTGAKTIKVYGADLAKNSPYNWAASSVVQFVYDGTYWNMTDTSALKAIGNWCYNNDITSINGGTIATGTVTAAQILANTVLADLILAQKGITAKGDITILYDELPTSTLNSIANQYFGKSYDSLSNLQKILCLMYGTATAISAFVTGKKLNVISKIGTQEAFRSVMTPVGLVCYQPLNTSSDDNASVYGHSADIKGDLKLANSHSPTSFGNDQGYVKLGTVLIKWGKTAMGSLSTVGAKSVSVTFDSTVPFTNSPVVTANFISTSPTQSVSDIHISASSTGFTAYVYSSGVSISPSFSWMAIGSCD